MDERERNDFDCFVLTSLNSILFLRLSEYGHAKTPSLQMEGVNGMMSTTHSSTDKSKHMDRFIEKRSKDRESFKGNRAREHGGGEGEREREIIRHQRRW
jgi:hypothetical protein